MSDRHSDDSARLFALIQSLWSATIEPGMAAILPFDADRLAGFYSNLQRYLTEAPHQMAGTIEPGANIYGDIISMAPGSVIEAGAIVHRSCRLILGANSVIRSGAVLRDEVVVGPDSLVGVHCEVVRSVLLGPTTQIGHFAYVADSILGSRVMVAGNTWVANTTVGQSNDIPIVWNGRKVSSRRDHLGMLVGDDVRFGASITVCPGCVIAPGLTLPPSVTLDGVIDAARRRQLMHHFAETWSARLR